MLNHQDTRMESKSEREREKGRKPQERSRMKVETGNVPVTTQKKKIQIKVSAVGKDNHPRLSLARTIRVR